MEIKNYDGKRKQQETKHHFLLPDCHYILIGATGEGKTNLLCSMIIEWLNYETCTIYTINPDQSKYKNLKTYFDALETESGKSIFAIESPDNVVPVEELDNDTHKIIVFDDIKLDRKNMNIIREYFSLSRNKQCNCIYLAQSYYDIDKYIRRNTKCFVLFGNLDNKDIRQIADDHCRGISREDFKSIYQEATDEPFSFMVLDKTTKYVPQMFRKRFDGFYLDKVLQKLKQ